MRRAAVPLLVLLACAAAFAARAAEPVVPAPTGYVNDRAGVMGAPSTAFSTPICCELRMLWENSRVQVPLPRGLRGLRDRMRDLTSGVTGWTLLATFSVATAAAWTTAAVLGVRFWGEISGAAGIGWRQALGLARDVFREGIVPGWALTRAEVSAWLASLGLNPTTVVIGYGIIALVCAVALWRLTAEPARSRGTTHAAH